MPQTPSLTEDHAAFAAMLRFVARKTAEADPQARTMAAILEAAADGLEREGRLAVVTDQPELAARAFAGFAAFLQKRILPEAVAHANGTGERQIRFAVDQAMDTVHHLMTLGTPG